jgi:hypothetical protein
MAHRRDVGRGIGGFDLAAQPVGVIGLVCVFRAKSAADSGMKSASDSDLISAIPI